ncbi:VanZ family protein [Arthrobacter sp. H35-D1]|uniref:VanZ family protein n=1 Tax=Arthrobacter sp. H35-D1 TaxID=3046202 RepID=UPI0024BAFB52|nr:VanZ family protein [Arthrobacter sp. H35-D1]MDJ0313993.1 VanZ family protein [Arthrobacter sp. H35-D1]
MTPTNRRLHRISLCLMAAYLVALVLIVFWPTPVDRPAAGSLNHFIAWIHRRSVPTFIGYGKIEFSANIAMFIPMGIIASAWTKQAWAGLLVGFMASVCIELAQALFLAERFASGLDVLANTLGAGIGATLYFVGHRHHQNRHVVLAGDGNHGH